MKTIEVQCNCGAVKMRLRGEPIAQLYCHCDDCQAVHGAAYVPAAMYSTNATEVVSGEVLWWKRKTTLRASCRACGARLFSEPPGLGVRAIVAYLLPEGSFTPTFHMQCQHALLPVKDALPHFKGFPAMWGGSDEKVSW